MNKFALNIVVGILIFTLGFALGIVIPITKDSNKTEKTEAQTTMVEPQKAEEEEKAEPGKASHEALADLQQKLEDTIRDGDGSWAVYVEELSTGAFAEVGNKKMVSASLIKLFIMAKVYEEIEEGTIEKSDVESYLNSMITVSDNDASNILVAKLGGGKYTDMYADEFQKGLAKVNEYAARIGCTDSEQQRDMMSYRAVPVKEENFTSVADCGRLLGKIYRKELVSEKADAEMLSLLKKQTRRGKIPAGLPGDVVCANKTGELSDTENDVALVFSPGGDYIICVMSNDVSDTGAARGKIADISQMVYNYFN